MGVQVILLAVKPVDLHFIGVVGTALGLLVLLHLNHAQMVETAANQALHILLLQLLIMRMCLQVKVLVLNLVVLVLQIVKLVLITVCLLLQFSLMLLPVILLTSCRIVILCLDHLLQLIHSRIVLQLLSVPLVLVALVVSIHDLDRLLNLVSPSCAYK